MQYHHAIMITVLIISRRYIVMFAMNSICHIICGSSTDISVLTLSCYNCGESGHSGLQCPKPLLDRCGSKPPSICYKCGEEGHVARNCSMPYGFTGQCISKSTVAAKDINRVREFWCRNFVDGMYTK